MKNLKITENENLNLNIESIKHVLNVNSTVTFKPFIRSQKYHYFEHFEREIGYLLPRRFFLS